MKVFITTLSTLLLAATSNAFTVPRHGATIHHHSVGGRVVGSSYHHSSFQKFHTPPPSQHQIHLSSAKKSDSALHVSWRGRQEQRDSRDVIEDYADATMSNKSNRLPPSTAALGGFGLTLFSTIGVELQNYLNKPCLDDSSLCTEEYYKFAQFFAQHETLAFVLLLTHAIPFALLPYTMAQINKMGPVIQKDHPEFNPFVMQLAFACTAFGLALEFGWHVSDSWYYGNEFHILNFGFYFFLISSFALWADGFKSNPKMDIVFAAILLFATALYPAGNAMEVGAEPSGIIGKAFGDLLGDASASSAKIPLYIGMTTTFASITARGREIFGNKMWVTFFLSVVVNLGFIFLLNGYEYTKNPELSEMNYIYHICHDLLGTELGVFYFATLIRDYVPIAERK